MSKMAMYKCVVYNFNFASAVLVSSPDCRVLPTRKAVLPFSKDFFGLLSRMLGKRVSQSGNNHVISRQDSKADRYQYKGGMGTYQYFTGTGQSVDSASLGVVIQIESCVREGTGKLAAVPRPWSIRTDIPSRPCIDFRSVKRLDHNYREPPLLSKVQGVYRSWHHGLACH